MKPKKLSALKQAQADLADLQLRYGRQSSELITAKTDLETVREERTVLYEKEYARRTMLAGLIGKLKQNIAEFTRVFEQLMEK